ncbi:alpha/beta fold hydrolase [candidate division KSB1 bacterium]|nr:alpha/beta fold hydrolase [candidate division KSB1 bacterium]
MKTKHHLLESALIAKALAVILLLGCKSDEQKHSARSSKMDQAVENFWVNGAAGKLFVDRGGAGDLPVVMVHSLAGNTTQWQAQLDHLRKTRLAIAFDMRGHGQSELARDQDYSLAAMAHDLATVVDSLGLTKFILVGHSYGGGVVAVYAGRHPDRVAGLLFVDPIGDGRQAPQEEIHPFMAALRSEAYAETIEAYWRSILTNADSAVVQAVITSLRKTPKEAVLDALESVFAFDPAAALKSYRGPMQTIVSGLPDNPAALHHAVADLPHVVLPNTSHWLQMDRPEEFNRLMEEFLNKL